LVKAIRSGQARGGELPEGVLGLRAGKAKEALQVVRETGTALAEQGAGGEGFRAEGLEEFFFFDALSGESMGEPVGRLTDEEGDGRSVGGDDTARRGSLPCGPGGVGRDAAPADGARQAESVQPAGVIVCDACGEQGALPLDCGRFKAFKLRESLEQTFFSGKLGLRRQVLPAKEPAHVGGRRNGLNLLAQRAEGKAVDALEDAAFAPLDFMRVRVLRSVCCGCGVLKCAAQEEALHLHGEEGFIEGCGRDTEERGHCVRSDGAKDL